MMSQKLLNLALDRLDIIAEEAEVFAYKRIGKPCFLHDTCVVTWVCRCKTQVAITASLCEHIIGDMVDGAQK